MKFKRILAALMAITILFSLSIGVSAATVPDATIDPTRTGSIDIYKYDLTMANTDDALASLLESYVSTGVKDAALEAAMDDGTVNDLGNGQQSYGYAIKGVEFSYLKIADICTYSETEADGVHRTQILYKMDDAKDAALLSALGLTNNDAYPVVASYAETGFHFFKSDTLIDALSSALASNATTVKNALENYMAAQNAGKFDETDAHGHTAVDELPLGLYLIVETKVPEMVISTCNPFFVSVPMTSVNGTNADNGGEEWLYSVTLYPKNETGLPTLEKTVREDKDDTGKNNGSDAIDDGYEHNATASTGDKLNYQFWSKLPAITSDSTAITVWSWLDTMSKGLEYNGSEAAENAGLLNGHYNPNDVEIHFFRDAAMTDKITDWNLTDETPKFSVNYRVCGDIDGQYQSGTTMEVTVLPAGLNEINTATTVHNSSTAERGYSNCYVRVTYSATLNQNYDTVTGDLGNPNKVVLTWKRSNMDYLDALEDDAHVYSYGLDIWKNFSDGRGDYSKVSFKLYNVTDQYWVTAKKVVDGSHWVYFVDGHDDGTIDEGDDKGTTFTPCAIENTKPQGYAVRIVGVEDDEYLLFETTTDNRYTLLKDPTSIVITATEDENRPCSIYDNDVLGLVQNDERYQFFEGYSELSEHFLLTAYGTVNGKAIPNVGKSQNGYIEHASLNLTIINTRGPELPKTGDNGVWMYGPIGLAFILVACGILFLAFRKRKTEDK